MTELPSIATEGVRKVRAYGFRNSLHRAKRLVDRALGRGIDKNDLYASHLPVLVGLARLLPIKRVLELGCGDYSTLTFLNRRAYPDLLVLHSLENDSVWLDKITQATSDDPRISVKAVSKSMSSAVPGLRLQDYDLVLVDDSTRYVDRAETIHSVAFNRSRSNLVVVHDYEMHIYQHAARSFTNRFAFTSLTPNTGVVWDDVPVETQRLKELDALIGKHSQHVKPGNVAEWIQVIDENY